jgi:hypothetical protein
MIPCRFIAKLVALVIHSGSIVPGAWADHQVPYSTSELVCADNQATCCDQVDAPGPSIIQRKATMTHARFARVGGNDFENLTYQEIFHRAMSSPLITVVFFSACLLAISVAFAVASATYFKVRGEGKQSGDANAVEFSAADLGHQQGPPGAGVTAFLLEPDPCDTCDPQVLVAPICASHEHARFGGAGTLVREMFAGEQPILVTLCVVVVIQVLSISMLIPVLPFFAIEELQLGPSQMGIVSSASSAAQLLGSSASGRLSDSIGRRPLLIMLLALVQPLLQHLSRIS